jgi:hypothetical protein
MQTSEEPKKNKKTKIIFLFVAFVVLIAGYVVYRLMTKPKTTTSPPTTTNKQQGAYNDLLPGESALSDVEKALGKPLSEQEINNLQKLEFKSVSETRNNEAIIKDQKLAFFKEMVYSNKTAEDITKQYGVTDNILYGPDAYNGYNLYVYPENGIAYLGNPVTRDLLEIWYFSPTTLDDFKQNWAADYSDELTPKF